MVGRADEDLGLDLTTAGLALAVAIAENEHPVARHALLDGGAHRPGAARLGAHPARAVEQRLPAARIGLEGGHDRIEGGATRGGVRALGLGREGDRDGRGLLGGERDRRQHRRGARHGAGHGANGGWAL